VRSSKYTLSRADVCDAESRLVSAVRAKREKETPWGQRANAPLGGSDEVGTLQKVERDALRGGALGILRAELLVLGLEIDGTALLRQHLPQPLVVLVVVRVHAQQFAVRRL